MGSTKNGMVASLVNAPKPLRKLGETTGQWTNQIPRCGSEWAGLRQRGRCKKRKCVSADLSLSFGHGRLLGERGSQEALRNLLALSRNEKNIPKPERTMKPVEWGL